jgi:hypothetical protein
MIDQRRQGLFSEGRDQSTFGGGELGNLEVQGGQQAFFAGQDFRNNEINNLLKRRGLISGQQGVAQAQNLTDINASMGAAEINNRSLDSLNRYKQGGYNQQLQTGMGLFDRSRQDYQNQIAARNQLISAGIGAVGGALRF